MQCSMQEVFIGHEPCQQLLSSEAVTIRFPSGLNRAEQTTSPCSIGSASGWPVWAFHTRAVLSYEAVTIRLPSGLNCAEEIKPPCFMGSASSWPVWEFHTRTVSSSESATIRFPSGSNNALINARARRLSIGFKLWSFVGSAWRLPG